MPLARIITNNPEDARILLRRLEAHGYTTEIVRPGEVYEGAADLEIELETLDSREALAKAARLSQGKQVSVLVASDCVELPQAHPEEVSFSQQLLEAADQARAHTGPALEDPAEDTSDRTAPRVPAQIRLATLATQAGNVMRRLGSGSRRFLQQLQLASLFLQHGRKRLAAQSQVWKEKWRVLRERQALAGDRRHEARLSQMKEAELLRSRRQLLEQEQLRQDIARKRHADEERERHRQLQEQLRRLEQAEEAERRQHEREAQLERQRLEALRLAEERERVVKERTERERAAEEARRLRAEEMQRQRQREPQEVLLQGVDLVGENPEQDREVLQETASDAAENAVLNQVDAGETASNPVGETVGALASVSEKPRRSRWDGELNSPYHPGWTWAAATAGAVTVGIMLLWTAVDSNRSSVVQFEPVSPSSLLPSRHKEIQQQVPFGPVKLVIEKPVQAPAAVPAMVPVAAAPEKISAPPPTRVLTKPAAAKPQIAKSPNGVASETEPEVVVRHLTPPAKAQVPEAGQTATTKHYSDLN